MDPISSSSSYTGYNPAISNANSTSNSNGGATSVQSGMSETSNTDLASGMVNQMTAQAATGANANAVQTADQMTNSLLNIVA